MEVGSDESPHDCSISTAMRGLWIDSALRSACTWVDLDAGTGTSMRLSQSSEISLLRNGIRNASNEMDGSEIAAGSLRFVTCC